MCQQVIEELDDASSLIEWIDRANWGENPFEWIFRGQRSDQWCLLPSAWRPGDRYLRDRTWQTPGNTSGEQCQSEYEMVRRFFLIGDVQGLPLPGDHPEFRARITKHAALNEFLLDSEDAWPPVELEWLIAIAQHYGVPTRFVDWSRKPLIAAWFAAEEAARQWGQAEERGDELPSGRFVVWALKRNSQIFANTNWEITTAPRSDVPNLHLQSGLFTFIRVARDQFDQPRAATELCRSICAVAGDDVKSTLRGASLPWREAGRLLNLLRDRFVQGTTVYAGYEGVARSVKEHRWRR